MRIGFGRRHMVISWMDAEHGRRKKSFQIPCAIEANDHELARLNATQLFAMDRPHWEPNVLLYGAVRTRDS